MGEEGGRPGRKEHAAGGGEGYAPGHPIAKPSGDSASEGNVSVWGVGNATVVRWVDAVRLEAASLAHDRQYADHNKKYPHHPLQ